MPGRRTALTRVLLGHAGAHRPAELRPAPWWVAAPSLGAVPVALSAVAAHGLLTGLAAGPPGLEGLALPLALALAGLVAGVSAALALLVREPAHGGAHALVSGELGARAAAAAGACRLLSASAIAAVAAAAAARLLAPWLGLAPVPLALALLAVVVVWRLRRSREHEPVAVAATLLFALVALGVLAAAALACLLDAGACPPPVRWSPLVADGPAGWVALAGAMAAGGAALAGLDAGVERVRSVRYPQRRGVHRAVAVTTTIAALVLVGVAALGAGRAEEAPLALAGIAAPFGRPMAALVSLAATAGLLAAASAALTTARRAAAPLASDALLPRQLVAHGERVLFARGLGVLAAVAAAALLASAGRVVVLAGVAAGVSAANLAFTLAAATRRRQRRGHPAQAALAAAAAAGTGGVALLALSATLTEGGWVLALAVVALALAMPRLRAHYADVAARLATPAPEGKARLGGHHIVLLLDRIDEATARALSYVEALNPSSIEAVAAPLAGTDLRERWAELAGDLPLEVHQRVGSRADAQAMRAALAARRQRHGPQATVTALLPETLSSSWVDQLARHRLALRLKAGELAADGIVVTDLTSPEGGPGPYTLEDPREHHVLILLSGVHRGTDAAMAYATALGATTVRGLVLDIDPPAAARARGQWEAAGYRAPLELVSSPAGQLSTSLRAYVREFAPDGRATFVTCVIPEVVVARRHRLLHNQLGRLVQAALLFDRGVVTTTVPTTLPPPEQGPAPPRG